MPDYQLVNVLLLVLFFIAVPCTIAFLQIYPKLVRLNKEVQQQREQIVKLESKLNHISKGEK